MIKNDVVYAVDTAQMHFFNRPLTKTESISQLAFLATHFADDAVAVKKLGKVYFETRNWQFEKSDEDALNKLIYRVRKKYIRKGLKKSLRTSRNFLRIKSGQYSGVFDKSFIKDASVLDFVKQLDSFVEAGQILERTNTSLVSQIKYNGKDIVVKRFNYKGLINLLRRAIQGSRAKRCWLNGQLLLMQNIPTPKPLAFIEKKNGLLLRKSYFITEYMYG